MNCLSCLWVLNWCVSPQSVCSLRHYIWWTCGLSVSRVRSSSTSCFADMCWITPNHYVLPPWALAFPTTRWKQQPATPQPPPVSYAAVTPVTTSCRLKGQRWCSSSVHLSTCVHVWVFFLVKAVPSASLSSWHIRSR